MSLPLRLFGFLRHSSQILCSAIHGANVRVFPSLWAKSVSVSFQHSIVCVGATEGDERVQQLFEGLLNGERVSLAESITLVESHHPKRRAQAQGLLSLVLQHSKKKYEEKGQKALSFRIGLTGPPGAGKSTFIETLGKLLTGKGHKVAVLAIDPSSSMSGGSLLGDKTRMLELSRDTNAYIRPSPAGGYLGGVARNTCDSVVLCECAGYDIIIIETVGVGQSEYAAADMVDMFALLIPPAGGDVLQGIKRGIVELADIVVVNKADGKLLDSARRIQLEYTSALKFVRRRSKVWRPKVVRVSSLTKDGIPELWEEMLDFWEETLEAGELEEKRHRQYRIWMWSYINHHLKEVFKEHPRVKPLIQEIENKVISGFITPGTGADMLIHQFCLK